MILTDTAYESLREQIHRLCGLNLLDDRRYLVRDRLGNLIQRHGLDGYDALAQRLKQGNERSLQSEVVESIVTGETSFFRDPMVFSVLSNEIFQRIVNQMTRGNRPLRILSAGVSTGQEAYSLAMLAHENHCIQADPGKEKFSILATDISTKALSVASAGIYSLRDLERGLDRHRRLRYFDAFGERFRVKSELRERIEFTCSNFNETLAFKGPFDLICCRNVMIYFDDALRKRLCEQFYQLLNPQGWLVLGSAENLYGLSTPYRSIQFDGNVFCYQREED